MANALEMLRVCAQRANGRGATHQEGNLPAGRASGGSDLRPLRTGAAPFPQALGADARYLTDEPLARG